MQFFSLASVTVVTLFFGKNCVDCLQYLGVPISRKHKDFFPLKLNVTYKKIDVIDGKSFLRVTDSTTKTQYIFKINIEKNIPVIYNRLTGAVYVVYSQEKQKKVSIIKAFLDCSKKIFVVQNHASHTLWSSLTGNEDGTISFRNYDSIKGIQNLTRTVGDHVFLKTDNFGNQHLEVNDESENYFFPVYKDSKTGLPITFDELTGHVLLIDSNKKLYNLEYDKHRNFKAVDLLKGSKSYVCVDSRGVVVFSQEPCQTTSCKVTKIKNTICKTLPPKAVKRMFNLSIEVNNQGKSFVRSDDPELHATFHTPIDKLDDLPVVYDFITTNTYLVNEQMMTQLFKSGNDYVIKNPSSKTRYSKVTANGDKLTFIQYKPKALVNVTRLIDVTIQQDTNKNSLLLLKYSGGKRKLPKITTQNFMVTRNYMNNLPIVNNPLTCETMLVDRLSAFTYRLEKSIPKKYVAVDLSTWVRRQFTLNKHGDVEIIFKESNYK